MKVVACQSCAGGATWPSDCRPGGTSSDLECPPLDLTHCWMSCLIIRLHVSHFCNLFSSFSHKHPPPTLSSACWLTGWFTEKVLQESALLTQFKSFTKSVQQSRDMQKVPTSALPLYFYPVPWAYEKNKNLTNVTKRGRRGESKSLPTEIHETLNKQMCDNVW